MAITQSGGTKLFIGGTGSLAGESSWQQVAEIVNMDEILRQWELVTHTPLDTRLTDKFKGAKNDGGLTIQLGRDLADAGQADMNAAFESDSKYNFKIELPDDIGGTGDSPTTITFKALVMSFSANVADVNSMVGATAALELQTGTYTEDAASAAT